jgi:hypothetical protein
VWDWLASEATNASNCAHLLAALGACAGTEPLIGISGAALWT